MTDEPGRAIDKAKAEPPESRPKRRAAHFAKLATDPGGGMIKDAERTRAEILAVATEEFSRRGFSGGRVNEIALKTRTSKRMIYYYFGSKAGLYQAVLLEHYRRLRTDEGQLALDSKPPLEALQRLVHFTFDWYVEHAAEVPLVMVENIHQGAHIRKLPALESLNSKAIDLVQRIYERGVKDGAMRPGIRPIDIYMSIAAASFFNISNRHTVAALFGYDMADAQELARRRIAVTDMIISYVTNET